MVLWGDKEQEVLVQADDESRRMEGARSEEAAGGS